ncbi:MAG: anhydro-N-acetylmuramic acid kinase, partial [Proteobacteria bacterium]|nr:anhydro-N-acetylmuramic acid kinase [Burkholderiales bacterium]
MSADAGRLFVGLMSGTSVDGIDAIVADFSARPVRALASHYLAFPPELRARLLSLSVPGHDEIDRAAEAGLALAELYAEATRSVIDKAGLEARTIAAIGCHGQTIRHRPERGYTVQIGNPAALAERTGICVVADFRAADMAAGGQGAPLAPGFHVAMFADPGIDRVVLNLGGIANLTRLTRGSPVVGFDCGPANILLDAWIERNRNEPFDRDGRWARSGQAIAPLLARMSSDPFFALAPPKSTGRDLFDIRWIERHLSGDEAVADVQATLLALTAESVAQAIQDHCPGTREIVACGGGVRNAALLEALGVRCAPAVVRSSAALGIA